jgi:cytochrome c oxidase subunit III
MSLLHKTLGYLDHGQQKRSNSEVMLVIVMASIFMLFLPLIIKLLEIKVIAHDDSRYFVPNEFGLSTLLILSSTWVLYLARLYKVKDLYKKLRLALLASIMLGCTFLIFQFYGWRHIFFDLKKQEVKIIAVIVIFHGLHFMVALTLLTLLLFRTMKIKSGTDHYIYFLNPKRNLLFKTVGMYWDYLGFLWTALYALMLVKFM